MKESGARKWFGFVIILAITYVAAIFLKLEFYKIFVEYAFYAFLVFVGGNALEHIKEIVKSFRG